MMLNQERKTNQRCSSNQDASSFRIVLISRLMPHSQMLSDERKHEISPWKWVRRINRHILRQLSHRYRCWQCLTVLVKTKSPLAKKRKELVHRVEYSS